MPLIQRDNVHLVYDHTSPFIISLYTQPRSVDTFFKNCPTFIIIKWSLFFCPKCITRVWIQHLARCLSLGCLCFLPVPTVQTPGLPAHSRLRMWVWVLVCLCLTCAACAPPLAQWHLGLKCHYDEETQSTFGIIVFHSVPVFYFRPYNQFAKLEFSNITQALE